MQGYCTPVGVLRFQGVGSGRVTIEGPLDRSRGHFLVFDEAVGVEGLERGFFGDVFHLETDLFRTILTDRMRDESLVVVLNNGLFFTAPCANSSHGLILLV